MSGSCRRVEGFLAQVLQRRRNHGTFKLYRVDEKARPEMTHGVRFFTTLRDLVATGFWSSKVGVADIGYLGNRPAAWDGTPVEVLKKLALE